MWVNASNSRESVLTGVIDLEFKACLTKHSVVPKTYSVTRLLPMISYSTRFTLRTRRCQEPPRCGAPGGLSFQATHLCAKLIMPFQLLMHASRSFSAPTKFVQLSDQIVLGVPRRAVNRSMSMTQELVYREIAISRRCPFFSASANRSKVTYTRKIKWLLLLSETFDR